MAPTPSLSPRSALINDYIYIYIYIYCIYIYIYIIYIYIYIYIYIGPPCYKNFQMPGHNFNTHAKFTIIEEVYNKSLSKLKIRSLLEHREFEIANSFPARSKHIT